MQRYSFTLIFANCRMFIAIISMMDFFPNVRYLYLLGQVSVLLWPFQCTATGKSVYCSGHFSAKVPLNSIFFQQIVGTRYIASAPNIVIYRRLIAIRMRPLWIAALQWMWAHRGTKELFQWPRYIASQP